MKNRKAFNFYSSYDDVIQDLDDKQLVLFMRALLDVQFLREHIDNISFKDKILSICWKAIKHSVNKQIEGYCNANKINYNSLFSDTSCAHEAPYEPTAEAHIKGASPQEEVQEEVQVQYVLENEFQAIWKDYTLVFLKTQGRGGGNKANARKKFQALLKKGYSLEDVNSCVVNEKKKSIGHRDLERTLTVDNMNQIKEDGVISPGGHTSFPDGSSIEGNFQ
jgi:hypothetical protein